MKGREEFTERNFQIIHLEEINLKKIALRSMGTSTFFSNKKVISTNINECFDWKMHFIFRITKTFENKFLYSIDFFIIDFYILKAKMGNPSRTGKSHLLGHVLLLHIDTSTWKLCQSTEY